MAFEELTPEIACEVLSKADLHLVPGDVRVEAREERWVVRLPGRRLAWFAASDEGVSRLKTERRVLQLLRSRVHANPSPLDAPAPSATQARTLSRR